MLALQVFQMIPNAELGSHTVVLRSCEDVPQQGRVVRIPGSFLETTIHGHTHNLTLCLTLCAAKMSEAV